MSQRKQSRGSGFTQVTGPRPLPASPLLPPPPGVGSRFGTVTVFAPQGDDGDEDFGLSQTPTHSQVQRNLPRHSRDQVNQKVGGGAPLPLALPWGDGRLLAPVLPQVSELVQYLLVKDQKKIPIKRAGELGGAPKPRSPLWGGVSG